LVLDLSIWGQTWFSIAIEDHYIDSPFLPCLGVFLGHLPAEKFIGLPASGSGGNYQRSKHDYLMHICFGGNHHIFFFGLSGGFLNL